MESEKILMAAGVTVAAVVGAFVFWGPSGNSRLRQRRGQIAGLHNFGQTCFLNTLLQALAACPQFIAWLQLYNNATPNRKSLISSLLSTLEVINGTHTSLRGDPYSPGAVLRALNALGWVIPQEEQDAHELFHVMLSTLEEEAHRPTKVGSLSDALPEGSGFGDQPNRPSSAMLSDFLNAEYGEATGISRMVRSEAHTPDSPASICDRDLHAEHLPSSSPSEAMEVDCMPPPILGGRSSRSRDTVNRRSSGSCRSLERLTRGPGKVSIWSEQMPTQVPYPFQGAIGTQIVCNGCGFKSTVRYDKFDSITLNLPPQRRSGLSLGHLLSDYITSEEVNGVKCESCNETTTHTKSLTFAKLPACLCIHIARTVWLPTGQVCKRQDYVHFPESLSMAPYSFVQPHLNSQVAFRIKEGTNINEIAVINDKNFPQQLCLNCFKKLQNVEEFRRLATQSFEYMISIMDDEIRPEDHLVVQPIKQMKENIAFRKTKHSKPPLHCAAVEMDNIKHEEKQEKLRIEIQEKYNDMEAMINTTDYSTIQHLETDAFKDVKEFADYSDNSNEDLSLDIKNNGFQNFDDNDTENNCLRKTLARDSKQCNINERNSRSKEKNINAKNIIKQLEEVKVKQFKESGDGTAQDNTKESDLDKSNKLFVCEDCSKIFSSKTACNRHQNTVHKFDASKMMHECLICSKKFKRLSHLTDHIKAVHEKLRPFKCSHCSKTFTAKNSRRVHELQHTGDYPFVCNWCGKMFRRSNQLKIHLEIHTTSPELLCPICKRSQKTQNDLENHLKSHDDKRLQCPLCGKFFSRSYHLKNHHDAVHLKLRPFKCQFCESAFGDRKTCRIHERTHTEDRPIKCSLCKSGFNTRSALTKHIHRYCHKIGDDESRRK